MDKWTARTVMLKADAAWAAHLPTALMMMRSTLHQFRPGPPSLLWYTIPSILSMVYHSMKEHEGERDAASGAAWGLPEQAEG